MNKLSKNQIIKLYMASIAEEPKEILLERIESIFHSMSESDLIQMYNDKFED